MSRPILPWHSSLERVPQDGQTVWIRRLPWYDKPVKAVFWIPHTWEVQNVSPDGQEDPMSLPVPGYMVHSWKYILLSDVPPGVDP